MKKLHLLINPFFWSDIKWKIRNFFFPQNKWLHKLIGRDYNDPQWIIENVMFATLVHFVEEEKGLDSILNLDRVKEDLENLWVSQEYVDTRMRIRGELEAAYRYIKYTKPRMIKERESLRPIPLIGREDWFKPIEGSTNVRMTSCEERYGMSYQEAYGPMNDLDEEMKALDTFYMEIIIYNRESLWT